MTDNEFITYWLERGQNVDSNDDLKDVFKFFCFFIAFNRLYEQHNGSQINRINTLIEKEFYNIKDDFNPFDNKILSKESELIKTQVSDVRNGKRYYDSIEYGTISLDNYKNLIDNIYQIRCNLFHGSKEMTKRDKDLVRESADVLESLIKCMIKRTVKVHK